MYSAVGIILTALILLAVLPRSNSSCTSFAALAEPCGCIISKESLDPLCGSDGGTYLNECFLECEKMITRTDIRINHKGMCHHQSRCSCHARYEPVCATNGATYSNDCVLKCNSKKDSSIRMSHKGECQGGGEKRFISRSVLKTCTCNPANGPMCATNGITYPNYCVMRCDSEALNDKSIQFAYWGVCDSKTLNNKNCNDKQTKQHSNSGTNHHANGLSYPHNQQNPQNPQNPRSSQNKVCDCPLNSITYYYRCGGTTRDACTCATQEPKSQQLKNICNDKKDYNSHPLNKIETQDVKSRCTCAAVHKPVCASNHETYANICVLQCHAQKDSGIKFEKMGDCSGTGPRLVARYTETTTTRDDLTDETLLHVRHFRRVDLRNNKPRRRLNNIKK